MIKESAGVPIQGEEGAVNLILWLKGCTCQPQKLISENHLKEECFFEHVLECEYEKFCIFLIFFLLYQMATWALSQYFISVTYIFVTQVRILLHIVGQEVCGCSNKKCVTSSGALGPATTAETCWLMFKMLMPLSWPAIPQNLYHDIRPWPRTVWITQLLALLPVLRRGYDFSVSVSNYQLSNLDQPDKKKYILVMKKSYLSKHHQPFQRLCLL